MMNGMVSFERKQLFFTKMSPAPVLWKYRTVCMICKKISRHNRSLLLAMAPIAIFAVAAVNRVLYGSMFLKAEYVVKTVVEMGFALGGTESGSVPS